MNLPPRPLFAALVLNAPCVICSYQRRPDGSACFPYASPKIEDIFGLKPEALEKDAAVIHSLVHPQDLKKVIQSLDESARTLSPWQCEFRVRSPKKGDIWIEGYCTPLRESDGSIVWHGFIHDITERKRKDEYLKKTQDELLELSRIAGMAEVATSVLHNVGNVLNSINVSTSLVSDNVRQSKIVFLSRAAGMMREHAPHLAEFLTQDEKGRQLPEYLDQLGQHLAQERNDLLAELDSLKKNVEHIRDVIAMQQSYSKLNGTVEKVRVADLIEDALRLNMSSLDRHDVQVVSDYNPDELPPVTVQKHKVLQILVNLISNAKNACKASGQTDRCLTIRATAEQGRIRISVADNGVGIAAESLPRLFTRGFTTRKDGHGFGLHSGLITAREIGGTLKAESPGPGKGSTFTLELPVSCPSQ